MVWYGMVWYGMVWYGMVWYDMMYVALSGGELVGELRSNTNGNGT